MTRSGTTIPRVTFPDSRREFHVSGPADNHKVSPAESIKGGFSGSAKFCVRYRGRLASMHGVPTRAVAMSSAPVVINLFKDGGLSPQCGQPGLHWSRPHEQCFQHASLRESWSWEIFISLRPTCAPNNVIRVFDDKWKDVTADYRFQTPSSVGRLHPFNILDLKGPPFRGLHGVRSRGSDEGQEQIPGSRPWSCRRIQRRRNPCDGLPYPGGSLTLPGEWPLTPADFGSVFQRPVGGQFRRRHNFGI